MPSFSDTAIGVALFGVLYSLFCSYKTDATRTKVLAFEEVTRPIEVGTNVPGPDGYPVLVNRGNFITQYFPRQVVDTRKSPIQPVQYGLEN